MKLPLEYYLTGNVVELAKDLIGKGLYTCIDGRLTGGIITETEAYAGVSDKGSHAYGGRFTKRTEVMFRHGGVAYVYLCYGIHALFNVVTNVEGNPDAVLIRGIKPTVGIEDIRRRQTNTNQGKGLVNGPGKVSKALGIEVLHTGTDLTGNIIWIEDQGINPGSENIISTTRIGIAYAAEDALLPYRFLLDRHA